MAGSNITTANDTLKKVSETYLFQKIRKPEQHIVSDINRLRIIYSIDSKRYNLLKKELPYIVCGVFSPPFRRKENFAYIDRFIIDIDRIEGKGLVLEEIKSKIIHDDRVLMCFTSPSEDGLKVMFRLEERCYDPNIYSVFYKEFVKDFSSRYSLEQVVDDRTSDVSRACFISMDAEAYYNADAMPVKLGTYVNPDDTSSFFDMIHSQEKSSDEGPVQQENDIPSDPKDPDEEILEKIRARLNPKAAKAKENREIFVPPQIETIMSGIKQHVEENNITLNESINIQYGKKLRFSLGLKQAEVNLFYGKRGFSVVISPRCGTDKEMNDIVAELIREYINDVT